MRRSGVRFISPAPNLKAPCCYNKGLFLWACVAAPNIDLLQGQDQSQAPVDVPLKPLPYLPINPWRKALLPSSKPFNGFMQPAAPTANPLLTLLDLVDSPLLLFNPEGQVVFTNRAAKRMDTRPGMALPGDPNVRQLVQQVGQNKVVLQLDMMIEVNSDQGMAQLRCQCAPKPIAGLVAMMVTQVEVPEATAPDSAGPAAPNRLSLQQIVELIGGDLMEPIEAVLAQAQVATAASAAPMADAVQSLKQRLERLSDLVTVFGEDVLIGDERILMPELVRSVCQELTPQARAKAVEFLLDGDRNDLPPVYGSRKLIRRAVQECLGNAVSHAHAPAFGNQSAGVRVKFQSSGHHLILNVANLGVLTANDLSQRANSLFRAEPPKADDSPSAPPEAMQIGLPLTHRILELHGGRLRIDESNGEIDVMLELPTGAPLKNTHHLDLLQAQIYAEDLSTLLARGRSRSKV
jgi:nitrogen-specific signal transduction histidine kinase